MRVCNPRHSYVSSSSPPLAPNIHCIPKPHRTPKEAQDRCTTLLLLLFAFRFSSTYCAREQEGFKPVDDSSEHISTIVEPISTTTTIVSALCYCALPSWPPSPPPPSPWPSWPPCGRPASPPAIPAPWQPCSQTVCAIGTKQGIEA